MTFPTAVLFQIVQASCATLEVGVFKFGGFFKSSDFQNTEHLLLSGFPQDLSMHFLVLEQLFGSFDFESCFETSPIVNCLFCFKLFL